MAEATRVAAVRTSTFAPNGDGDIPSIDLQFGAIMDVGQNKILEATGIDVIEIPDTIAPVLVTATMNFSLGELDLVFKETLDITPISHFNFSQIHFANSSVNGEESFALDGLFGVPKQFRSP